MRDALPNVPPAIVSGSEEFLKDSIARAPPLTGQVVVVIRHVEHELSQAALLSPDAARTSPPSAWFVNKAETERLKPNAA